MLRSSNLAVCCGGMVDRADASGGTGLLGTDEVGLPAYLVAPHIVLLILIQRGREGIEEHVFCQRLVVGRDLDVRLREDALESLGVFADLSLPA